MYQNKSFTFAFIIIALFFLTESLFPFKVSQQYSMIINDSEGKLIHAFLNTYDKWRLPIEEREISAQLEKAILYKENQWYYRHLGVNPVAHAAYRNIISGRRTSGASTISMQVVRLLDPKKRSFGNKILEMFQAVRLELHYSKKEILQIYLIITPYGSNI